MGKNNQLKIINCVNCTKFCQNGDKAKIDELIKKIKKQGFKKIDFSCDLLKTLIKK